jgi:tripartite-type tricarboxylate transporter receptor subunit TctC
MRLFPALAACCAVAAIHSAATAATFPQKPVRLVVGYAPGGGADVLARLVGRRLSDGWTQPVVIENRAGAGGTIAAGVVANAPPDGYTILMITTNHTVPSSEYKNTNYDPIRSFAPVIEMAQIPSALVVGPSVRANSVKELIDLARAKPGALNFGSTGPGTAQFMDMHLLMQSAGIRMVNVTYKGAGLILVALLSNEIQVTLSPITAFLEAIRGGRLKALGVTGTVRSRLLPDVPTYSETTALQGFEGSANWYGIVAPAGTSRNIVGKLHDDVITAMAPPEVQRLLSEQGFVPVNGTPEQFTQRIVDDLAKWSKLIKTVDIR